jgi:hypothetical protein
MALNAETTERNKSRYRGLVPFPKKVNQEIPAGEPNNSRNVSAYVERLRRALLVD